MILFKHRRSAERDAFSVPRSVQKSIPIKRIYQDGVFQVSGKFSKTWRFFDVNYAVASPEKQRELFMTYCSFLNSLPIGATAKITLFNRQLNQKDFGRTLLMPMQGDRRDLYRNEYNALVLGKAAESNNLIQEKYITVSAEKKSVEEARAFFSRVGTDLTTGLSRMSSSVREITVNDRLRLLHDFYRPGEEQLFRFNLEDTMRRGHDFRDSIAPDCISFQKNHYELGDHVGRTLFLREYASFISDAMITELMDYPRNMMLSIDIIPVAMDEAVSDIRKRIMSVESDITRWQQRQNQNNNFTANIPYDLEQMRSETKEFMTDLMNRDQRMMLALVTLTHLADNLEQLDQDTEALQAIGRARGCQFNILRYQQEDALNTVLPLGLKRIDATRTIIYRRQPLYEVKRAHTLSRVHKMQRPRPRGSGGGKKLCKTQRPLIGGILPKKERQSGALHHRSLTVAVRWPLRKKAIRGRRLRVTLSQRMEDPWLGPHAPCV